MSSFDGENEDLLDEWQEERMFDELRAARTAPAKFVCVRQCGCGVRWDLEGWTKLKVVGVQVEPADDEGPEKHRELRNCICGSTISIEVTP